MTLSPAFLDEIRARTTLSALIAPHVKLIRAGREYKACCPFHDEKTPSFTINDDKGFYHCFGCQAHGDAIRFLTDHRGLPFIDAVKELAAAAGMEMPAPDPKSAERAQRQSGLHEVTAACQAWFAEQLARTGGAEARAYLQDRGIGAATAARFGIGLAPDGRTRLKAALGATLGEERLIETGMLIQPDEPGKESYDRFRARLMIPIRDLRGRVIGFGGRLLGPGEPKYLNSPETPLFDKGRSLYNIDRAGPASRQARRVVVVEGYMDVIALDRAGIAEAVAPNGTALTEAQLELLWRIDPQPVLCFDGDRAGQKAAIRAAMRSLPLLGPERTLRFVALPEGQDPDDLLRVEGPERLEELLQGAEPLVDRLWAHERDQGPLKTPEERAGLRQRLIDHASAIGDRALSGLYRSEWLERFDALTRRPARTGVGAGGGGRGGGGKGGQWVKGKGFVPAEAPPGATMRTIGSGGINPSVAEAVLTGLTLYPEAIAPNAEAIAGLRLGKGANAVARDRLLDAALSGDALSGEALDRVRLATILSQAGASPSSRMGRRGGGMAFSFTRPDGDPAIAIQDLGVAIEALNAQGDLAAAFVSATERAKRGDHDAFDEQSRLHAAREEQKERLAKLTASD